MRSTGFEPAIPASERSQTHALDHASNGIVTWLVNDIILYLRGGELLQRGYAEL